MADELTTKILELLDEATGPFLSSEAFRNVPSTTVKSALDRLGSRDMVAYKTLDREEYVLSEEANGIVANGSHEARVFEAVRKSVNGLKISDLPSAVGKESATVGRGKAFAAKWIRKDEKDKNLLRADTDSIVDITQDQLRTIAETKSHPDLKVLAELRKRKLVAPQKVLSYEFTKGSKYAKELIKEETDLTAEMLQSGAWKDVQLKQYNFKAQGAKAMAGALHPLLNMRSEFRKIFFEMGFEEMPTDNFVETGFWNFDALFVPQQHPARDLQDTFYISDPAQADHPRPDPSSAVDETKLDYEQYWQDIHEVHEHGKFGSIGYRTPWKESEALRLVLRTHTTANSASMLFKLAANPRPARYFSIDRVFRNETVDKTHLAEFHQVEGVIADYNLTLGGLISFMEIFFAKMGIHNLRFKPAYNPYTEPSMEIFGWHEGFQKWVEIGNSGMFRPEMLQPMGIPKDMRIFGWGLSVERPLMIREGINNIRKLVGHNVPIDFVENSPAVRLDKE